MVGCLKVLNYRIFFEVAICNINLSGPVSGQQVQHGHANGHPVFYLF